MKRYLVLMICLTAGLMFLGCEGLLTAPEQPKVEVTVKDNNGPVSVEVDTNESGDDNGDIDQSTGDCLTCDTSENLCSDPSCTDVDDSTCTQNGGPRLCQPCSNCS